MPSIEDRIAKLEEAVFGTAGRTPGKDDWQKTVGMFKDDPIMKEITDGALEAREEERRQARAEVEDEGDG